MKVRIEKHSSGNWKTSRVLTKQRSLAFGSYSFALRSISLTTLCPINHQSMRCVTLFAHCCEQCAVPVLFTHENSRLPHLFYFQRHYILTQAISKWGNFGNPEHFSANNFEMVKKGLCKKCGLSALRFQNVVWKIEIFLHYKELFWRE